MGRQSPKTVYLGPGEGPNVWMPGVGSMTRKVSAQKTGGAYCLFEVEVGRGGGEPPHVQHRECECLYVLDGEFEFLDDGGGAVRMGPGSVVYVPNGGLHRYRNVSGRTGRLLAIHTPGGSYERFVEEAGEPASKEPPDSGRLAAIGARHGIEMEPHPPPPDTGTGNPSEATGEDTDGTLRAGDPISPA